MPRAMPTASYLTGGNIKALTPTMSIGKAKGGPNAPANRAPTMEQKIMLGLCFKCGNKYDPDHQCRRHLLNMEGEDGEEKEHIGEEK